MTTEPDSIPAPAAGLAGDLVIAGYDALTATNNRIISNLEDRAETAEATIDAIRDQVRRLFDGSYMPTPMAVRKALIPSAETIAEYREGDSL